MSYIWDWAINRIRKEDGASADPTKLHDIPKADELDWTVSPSDSDWYYKAIEAKWNDNNSVLMPYEDKLFAYWDMEETEDNDRIDRINSLALSATGSISHKAGKIGTNALDIDYDQASFLNTTVLDDIQPNGISQGYAFSLWVYFDTITTGTSGKNMVPILFGLQSNATTGHVNTLMADNYSDKGLRFETRESDGSNASVVEGSDFNTIGEWIHMVCIADKTSGKIHLYRNNVEVGTGSAWDGTFYTATNLFIGGINTPGDDDFWFKGGIDEVAIYRNISFTNDTEREAFVNALNNDGNGVSRV